MQREWVRRQAASAASTSSSFTSGTGPRLFEHFCIVGLPPTMNVKAVSADIHTYHTARRAGTPGMDIVPDNADEGTKQYGVKGPALPAEVLFTYPETPPLPDDLASNMAAFCFPQGVRPELLERTPSMSGLNEVVFGQPYQTQPDHSFVFKLSVADPGDPHPRPLYGVCCYARELLHRPPALARDTFPGATAPLARYMVTAPRCYCLLTRYPFFSLHFSVLHTILGLERLERMAAFAGEAALGLVHNPVVGRRTSVDFDGAEGSGAPGGSTGWLPRTHPEQQGEGDFTRGRLSGPYSQYGESSTTSISTATDVDDVSRHNSVHGLSGYATPPQRGGVAAESQEVESSKDGGKSIRLPPQILTRVSKSNNRGVTEGTEGLSPAPSTSSIGSELTPTRAPLLSSQTPFFTPSNPTPASMMHGRPSRRLTRVHGSQSPGPEQGTGQGVSALADAHAILQKARQKSIERHVLVDNDDGIEAVTRDDGCSLGSTPPVVAPIVPWDAASTSKPRLGNMSQAGSGPLPRLNSHKGRDPEGYSDSVIEGSGYATPDKSQGGRYSSEDLGAWVGATDAEGLPLDDMSAVQSSSEDLRGLNESLAALLTLGPSRKRSSPLRVSPTSSVSRGVGRSEPDNGLEADEILYRYLKTAVPQPGEVLRFHPDPSLQPIIYRRPSSVPVLRDLGLRLDAPALPDVEGAANLGAWTVAALCRTLSLDSILAFLSAALLERQMVLFCPNVGLLSGVALSLIPLLLPFSWQSLLLPVMPATPSRLDLLEAPVPFVVGILFKTPEVRARCGSLVRVNVYKDRVRNAGSLPPLPHATELADALAGPYAELARAGRSRAASVRPVHTVSETQVKLAQTFMSVIQRYLRGLVSDLKGYTITDVSHGSGEQHRVSVLLKESFIDSFPPRDRPFMRQFADTQMFSVYCDSVL